MTIKRVLLCATLIGLSVWVSPKRTVEAADEWLPIDPVELKMTAEAKAPGAKAIILYRQEDRNDNTGKETEYVRIKILTEEGRKQADVEIPFVKGYSVVYNIRARTIHPDGSVVNFDGKTYEKTIVKAKGLKYLAKTFTMPDVQVGSIIEYRYSQDWDEYHYFDSRWILSDDLFTKHAKFSLLPYERAMLRWSWQNLPPGTAAPAKDGATIRLEAFNIPAFPVEDYMPPEGELKAKVSFVYLSDNNETEPDKFWKKEGKKFYEIYDAFLGKKKAMEQAASQIVSAGDTPEVKLQKIYARTQQIRNLTFEKEKTEKEQKRDKTKLPTNVEEVWKYQYGDGTDITLLFVGLARGAGFEAYPIHVSRRDSYFFAPALMNPSQLNDTVAQVKLNGKDAYFDPGTKFTPYGYLPWAEAGVQGLKPEKEGGSWVATTMPSSEQAVVTRTGDFKMTETGGLEGKLKVTYSGVEAMRRRLEERDEDAENRKKYLEDEVKSWVPVSIDVELTNKPDWSSSSVNLEAEFDFKADGWASQAGKRALIPVGFFTAEDKHVFEHADRVHPLYFRYPWEVNDSVTVDLPLGWKVQSVPQDKVEDQKAIVYSLKVKDDKGVLQAARHVKLELMTLDVKYYATIRAFFQMVTTADEQQIVVQPGS